MSSSTTYKPITVPAVQIRQNGTTFYVATMLAGTLIQSYSIHIANPKKKVGLKNGYQRSLQPRVKKIAEYFAEDGSIMPLGGLANLRGSGGLIFESDAPADSPCREGKLSIPPSRLPLWLVDSQHRTAGIQKAIEDLEHDDLRNFPVILTIADGMDLAWEAEQFNLINTSQKKVATDLARQTLAALVKADPVKRLAAKKSGKLWEVQGVELVEYLNENCPALAGLIRLPNQTAKDNPEARLTASTFVTTIKQALALPGVARIARNPSELEQLFSNYWCAMKELIPEAFQDTKNYLLVRSVGAGTMHNLLGDAMDYARGMSKTNPYSVKNFKTVLAPIFNQHDEDFWHNQNKEEGAALFTSGGNQKLLAGRFRDVLYDAFGQT